MKNKIVISRKPIPIFLSNILCMKTWKDFWINLKYMKIYSHLFFSCLEQIFWHFAFVNHHLGSLDWNSFHFFHHFRFCGANLPTRRKKLKVPHFFWVEKSEKCRQRRKNSRFLGKIFINQADKNWKKCIKIRINILKMILKIT